MASLFDFMEQAGFVPLETNQVVIPNFRLPVFQNSDRSLDTPPPLQPLFCRAAPDSPPQATVLTFTIPGCENCRPGLSALQRLAASESEAKNVCFRIVVSDWQTQAEIVEELKSVSWDGRVGVVWDGAGILAERLAVLAHPSFFLLDSQGTVAAYRNGPVEFAAPGFQVFWSEFVSLLESKAKAASPGGTWAQELRVELPSKSSPAVMFLNKGLLSFVLLVAAVAVCYAVVRFFVRLRKNFTGS